MRVDGDTVITVPHKHIVYQHIIATHHVNAVTPTFATEGLQVLNGQPFRFSAKNSIMVGIHYCNAVNQYVFGMSHFNATNRVFQNTTPYNPYIFRLIHQ